MSEPQKVGTGENSTSREPYAPYSSGYQRNFEASTVANMPMSVYMPTPSSSDMLACSESEVLTSVHESAMTATLKR